MQVIQLWHNVTLRFDATARGVRLVVACDGEPYAAHTARRRDLDDLLAGHSESLVADALYLHARGADIEVQVKGQFTALIPRAEFAACLAACRRVEPVTAG